ncbi:MAG: methyltransferase domain-containing protein [Patescibacteria group bacterium]|nr:methyltransferase domain-containing protein [Patescibacteria group bacterium]
MHEKEKSVKTTFNRLKGYYDRTWDPAEHTLHVGLFSRTTRTLEKAYAAATDDLIRRVNALRPLDAESSVLDVGCGAGRTLISICERFGARGVGIDISEEQVKDARHHLAQVNKARAKADHAPLRVTFVCGTASDLGSAGLEGQRFSHVISQDAILLVLDKQALFNSLFQLMEPGGVLGIADFLEQGGAGSVKERKLVYDLVHWEKGLSFGMYRRLLKQTGFAVVTARRRDAHMIRTYEALAKQMDERLMSKDGTYRELRNRYLQIVSSVRAGKMGWGLFLSRKNPTKTVLIAGTKRKSIGRYVGKELQRRGWDVWLYSRHAKYVERPDWHERPCDITSDAQITRLLKEMPPVNLSLFMADTGGHFLLEEMNEDNTRALLDAKLVGSVLLTKALLKKRPRGSKTKLVWCAGKTSGKNKRLMLYSVVNSGLASFVEALNEHRGDEVEAYYLMTPLISPSTLGDAYIAEVGSAARRQAYHPSTIMKKIDTIIGGRVTTGIVGSKEKII